MEMRHEACLKASFQTESLFTMVGFFLLLNFIIDRARSRSTISREAAIHWSVLESKIERNESKLSKGSTTIDSRGVESFLEKKIRWKNWLDHRICGVINDEKRHLDCL